MAFEQWFLNEHLPLLARENYKPEIATYKTQVEEWFNQGYRNVVTQAQKNVAHYERKKLKVAPQDRLQCDLKIAEQWKIVEEVENHMKAKLLQDLSDIQAEKAQLAQQQAQERLPNLDEIMQEAGVDEEAAAFRSARLGG